MHCVDLLHDFRAFQIHFVKFLPCCVLDLFPQQALRLLCGFAKKHLSCQQRSYIYFAHICIMQPTKMIPNWKPIWSGMILLLIKDDCKCSRWQGFIGSLIAVIFIPWTPNVHNFLDFSFLLNLRQIGIFSRIVARNTFVLHSWMMTSVFGFPRSAYISFSRIWLELFQMHMHFLISIDSYFLKYSKTHDKTL